MVNEPTTFKPLSDEEVKLLEKKNVNIAKKIQVNDIELEAELDTFNKQEDVLYNPYTGNPLVVVRRLTMDEIDILTGKELRRYKEAIPDDVADAYDDKVYKVISDIIVKPKHDVNWWKNGHITPELVQVIIGHVEKILKNLGKNAENFR